mgnify:FL=1
MFLFLTNANSKLGFGHLRRCEYLKKELDRKKIKSYILNDSKRINLENIKRFIQKKKIKIILIDDYRYKKNHRKFFKNLECHIIQLNYFYDNDEYIDICINHLKKQTNKMIVLNSLKNIIIRPFQTLKSKKKNRVLIYFSNSNDLNFLKKIINIIAFYKKNYEINVVNNNKIKKVLLKKNQILFKKVKFINNQKNINSLLASSKILISGGGLLCLEAARYKVKNFVIFKNKFQKINSIYLKKNKIISATQDRKNFSYPKFIKNFLSLEDKKINFKKIDKKSTFNTAKYLINYFKKLI